MKRYGQDARATSDTTRGASLDGSETENQEGRMNNKTQDHVLDRPIPYHRKLLDYGERPYWTMDGKKIAFMVNFDTDEYGFGRGLGLLDLEGWGNDPVARDWRRPGKPFGGGTFSVG
jgi:hypothetical protein